MRQRGGLYLWSDDEIHTQEHASVFAREFEQRRCVWDSTLNPVMSDERPEPEGVGQGLELRG